jgi:hypothetical protein
MVVSTFELRDQTRRATLLPPRIWTGDLHEFHCREKKFQLRVVTLPSFFAVCAHICFNNKKNTFDFFALPSDEPGAFKTILCIS